MFVFAKTTALIRFALIFTSIFWWAVCLPNLLAVAQIQTEPVSLIEPDKPVGGWKSDFGAEFPDAKVNLSLASETFREKPVLRLRGDFRGGGNYVQASVDLPPVDVDTLSFWVKVPANRESLGIRIIDHAGQCNQLKLKIDPKGGWQHMVIPVARFFQSMESGSGLAIVQHYEKWGGPNEAKWHQPGKLLVIMAGKNHGLEPEILISDVLLHPASPVVVSQRKIPLDENLQVDLLDWQFNQGNEFPGAKGGLDLVDVPDAKTPETNRRGIRLRGDFREGGRYVGMVRPTKELAGLTFQQLRFRYRSVGTKQFSLRFVDQSGQCHQRGGIKVIDDNQWHEMVLLPEEVAGGEHWGGANDGKWHGQLAHLELMLSTKSSEQKNSSIKLADIVAVVTAKSEVAEHYLEDFETVEFSKEWKIRGDVVCEEIPADEKAIVPLENESVSAEGRVLRMNRSLEQRQEFTGALGPKFTIQPGTWQFSCLAESELHSPDNSFGCLVQLDLFDENGTKLPSLELTNVTGRQPWHSAVHTTTVPRDARQGQFRIQLNKTYGQIRLDQLSLKQLKPVGVANKVDHVKIRGEQLGNLFAPDQPVRFDIQLQCNRPLTDEERNIRVEICDYWGMRQLPLQKQAVQLTEKRPSEFTYQATLAWPAETFAVGKYHQLFVQVQQGEGETKEEFSGFAVLPESRTRNYVAAEIPFTMRNWDGRIREYVLLADRLGLRQIGLWGRWKHQAPYEPNSPQAELVRQQGNVWWTGTPAAQVEREGFGKVSETSLREGMKGFLEKFKDQGLQAIAIGNEPHGKGQVVIDNVKAYQAIYEAAKQVAPKIEVVGTSVEPNEEYFQAGYQNYLDAYDFHIYEHYENVRRTIKEYRRLMQKYDAVKPIHSTELGLNSQGQTRLAVSQEMLKKISVFFAEGGKTVSWFNILYPDPQGNSRGTSGNSHNMFDCKYSLYNPRLDAITHFHLLDNLCDKRFVTELQQDDGTQMFHFSNQADEHLIVLWNDRQDVDLTLPVDGASDLKLTFLDGSAYALTECESVAVSAGANPVMLHFKSSDFQMQPPKELNATFSLFPASVTRGEYCEIHVGDIDGKHWRFELPEHWKGGQVVIEETMFQFVVPQDTRAEVVRLPILLTRQNAGSKGDCFGVIVREIPIR